MNMEVTKRIEFECCYIHENDIEAHRCKLEVTVEGPQRFNDFGRVISYEELTRYMRNVVPDRSFLYWNMDVASSRVGAAFMDAGCRVQEYNFPISAENLCKYLADALQELLDTFEPGIRIIDLKLREDNNSYVSWRRDV